MSDMNIKGRFFGNFHFRKRTLRRDARCESSEHNALGQGWVKVTCRPTDRTHFALQDTTIPKLRQVYERSCRCKMRMSALSKVESPVSWVAERYGNGPNRIEPTGTEPATRATPEKEKRIT